MTACHARPEKRLCAHWETSSSTKMKRFGRISNRRPYLCLLEHTTVLECTTREIGKDVLDGTIRKILVDRVTGLTQRERHLQNAMHCIVIILNWVIVENCLPKIHYSLVQTLYHEITLFVGNRVYRFSILPYSPPLPCHTWSHIP